MSDPRRFAVLGWPIAHSRSPRIHRAAYERLGLPWTLSPIRVGEAGLQAFLEGRGPEWRGFAVTMPLKEEAFRLASQRDQIAVESGVVNTLVRLDDGDSETPRWGGYNTDVIGLAEALRTTGLDVRDSVVLGAGATAVSAVLALRKLGAESVKVLARRPEAAQSIADRFGETREPGAVNALSMTAGTFSSPGELHPTAVVSTLPGPAGHTIDIDPALLRAPLFDVAYDPWPSPLAARWEVAGSEAHLGVSMLIEQALIQLRIFVTGDPHQLLHDEPGLLEIISAAGVGG